MCTNWVGPHSRRPLEFQAPQDRDVMNSQCPAVLQSETCTHRFANLSRDEISRQ